MKILFLLKFYQPFDRGGSEWSSHDLAKLLVQKGHDVTILTPNYGSTPKEMHGKITIIRFPFPIKLKNPKQKIAPFYTSNIIWFIYTAVICLYLSKKNKYEIIHAHNNEFIPAVVLAGYLTNIPTVATFRDYQTLCPLGFCFWKSNKACSLISYITKDYDFFFKNYVNNKNIFIFSILLIAAVRAKFAQAIILFFSKKINRKVAVSKKVKGIFKANGIFDLSVIHNPVIIKTTSQKDTNAIFYIGKFSPGKGVRLLLDIIPKLVNTLPKASFTFIGSGLLEKEIKNVIKKNKLEKKVKILGQLPHPKVLIKLKRAGLVIVPSLWPEPLPRSVTESLLTKVPTVATNVGGIGEILKNNKYGILTDANSDDLYRGIVKAYKLKHNLKAKITKDYKLIKKHFSQDSVNSYLKIYKF